LHGKSGMSRPKALAEVSSGARETEGALAGTTARLNGIISSAMDAIISTDSRRRILLFNPAAEQMFGVSARQALGQRIDRFIPKRFRAAHSRHMDNFGKTGVSSRRMGALGILSGLRANGQEFPVEASISQVEVSGEKLFTVILRDVTQRDQADAERAKLAAIVESSQDAIISRNLDGVITSWNAGAEKLFGCSAEEMIGQPILRLIPAGRQPEEATILERLRRGERVEQYETACLAKDRRPVAVSFSISSVRDATGAIIGTSTIARDITERKRAVAALRESEERYRRLVEVSPEGIFILRNHRLAFANRAGLRLFRATCPDQVIGKSLFTFVLPDYRALMRRRLRQVLELGRTALILEEKIVRLDGTVCDVEMAASPFPDQGGVSIQVVMHDIGETKLLERGILRAIEQEQKRLGRDLHDGLCQWLTAAKFKATLLEHKLVRKSLAEASDARALEGQLNKAIEQAHGLAHGLNPVKLVARGLMAALEELAAGVESAFQLRCVCHFPQPVPVRDHIMANHLYRIAQEATQNAVQHGKAKNIRIGLKERGGCIVLTVTDDGVGFPRKVKRKAGMGLQNMQARAAIVGAVLEIRPRKQGGTLVTCRLEAPEEESKE